MATTPTRYRSIFTGQQIDTILSSVKNKLDASLIKNDYTGGANYIASAQLAQDLNNKINQFEDPNYLKNQILAIPDSQIYTTEEKNKLAAMSGQFLGSFADAPTRDSKVATANLLGGELTFLVNDGSGLGIGGWFAWNFSTNHWVKVPLFDNDGTATIPFPVASSNTVAHFDPTKFSSMKVLILGKNATNNKINIQEALVLWDGTNTYLTIYGEIGNQHDLFGLSTNYDGSNVNLIANTTLASTTLFIRLIAVM